MFEILYKYLILHKKAILPGVGVFYIERLPAKLEIADKVFVAPAFKIVFKDESEEVDSNFYNYLAKEQKTAVETAIDNYNDFAYRLQKNLTLKQSISLPQMGVLLKNGNGELQFLEHQKLQTYSPEVTAEKIIRPDAKHDILVGDTSRTNIEMQEMLAPAEKSKDYWWVFAIILAIIGIAAIVYYYVNNEGFR